MCGCACSRVAGRGAALRQRCACCWCDRRKARQLPAVAAAAAQAARRRAWGWRGHCSLALHLCLCPWQCRACSSCELVLQQLQGGTALCAAGARGCRRKRPALGQRPPRDRLQRMHAAHPGRSNARGAPCCLRRLLLGLGPGSHRVALLPCGIAGAARSCLEGVSNEEQGRPLPCQPIGCLRYAESQRAALAPSAVAAVTAALAAGQMGCCRRRGRAGWRQRKHRARHRAPRARGASNHGLLPGDLLQS